MQAKTVKQVKAEDCGWASQLDRSALIVYIVDDVFLLFVWL